jgi:hypothetical protein
LKIEDCKLKIEDWVDFRFFRLFLLIFLFLITSKADAQNSDTHFHAEYSIAAGSPELPFWLYANSDARLRTNSSFNSLLNLGFSDRLTSEGQRIQLQTGADLFSRFSDTQNTLHFQQLFLQADTGIFQIKIGRFFETIGLNEHDLSVGSMMISRNATPFPKIRLSTRDYISVPGTSDFLQFNFRYSEGVLERNRFVRNARVHQKYLYLRLNPTDELSLYGGLIHNLMWGGEHPVRGSMVSALNEYLRGIFAVPREGGPTPPGNAIGAYDFAAEYRFSDFTVKASRLFYLEDLISARFRSPWDGKWGLNIEKHEKEGLIHSFLYEHVNTIRQDSRGGQPPGRARYYWHWFYEQGWSYGNSSIGLPLITFDPENKLVDNNMLLGHHFGVSGNLTTNINYRALFTYTRNYGNCLDVQPEFEDFRECLIPQDADLNEMTITPLNELRKDQFSIMWQSIYRLPDNPNLYYHLSLAFDLGKLYKERIGILAGIRWEVVN